MSRLFIRCTQMCQELAYSVRQERMSLEVSWTVEAVALVRLCLNADTRTQTHFTLLKTY